jgi:CxxC motif-containing protein (DUF1111 family)
MKKTILITLVAIIILSCSKDDGYVSQNLNSNEQFSGGETTTFDFSSNAFSLQAPNISTSQGLDFFIGNSLFNQNWVTAPASTTARDGLGPLFNARSCSGCHGDDGRGRPPYNVNELSHGLLLRLSINGSTSNGGTVNDVNYGGQLQDQSIQNIDTEAAFEITYQDINGQYADGTSYTLQKPIYHITDLMYGSISDDINISPRVANQMIGLGLLEAIDETTILGFSDELDSDNDGISGRPNYVWDVATSSTVLGRFGWKANQPNLQQQVAGAFSGDIGITSTLFPEENCPPGVDCDHLPNGGSPEITDENLSHVTLYSSILGVPARRNWDASEVQEGKALFNQINCNSCHIAEITTGIHPTIDALSNQTIRPYTDMLLHDMGDSLSDNRTDFLAAGNEWRTPPLWGIGLIETVNGHTRLLHDGRARNIEEAILWHSGEAAVSKLAFTQLNSIEREKIITFLNTL